MTMALAWPASWVEPELERFEYRRLSMGVQARVVLYAADEDAARAAVLVAFARLDELDAALSDWRDDSELARVCARAGAGPVPVGGDLYRAVERALEMADLSGGAYDPTVGPWTLLWREARRTGSPPAPDALARAAERVGYRGVRLDPEAWTVELERAGMRLDLGGIGKGLAADEALRALRDRGVDSALVDLGGDLALGAPPPGARGWIVDAGCGGAVPARLVLARCAVATSGGTEQFLDVDGTRLSHLLDARTGAPLEAWHCATAIAPDGATADALASAAAVLGPREGRVLAVRIPGAELLFEDPRAEPLLDGASLAGWDATGAAGAWSVEDGCLVGRVDASEGPARLATQETFTSFALDVDVRAQGTPAAAIVAPGARVALDLDEGAWRHVELRCTGFDPRVELWVDGVARGEAVVGDAGGARAGSIALEVGSVEGRAAVAFRDARVRRLPVLGEVAAGAEGWRDLLAAGLEGWEAMGGALEDYALEDGVLAIPSSPPSGHLATRADFRDLRLRLDFQLARMANGGLFLRAARDGSNPAYSGCEVQMLDDFHWEEVTGTELAPWQRAGSLYGAVAAGEPERLRPIGEWNTLEVLYRGARLAVALNGHVLYDVDTHALGVEPAFRDRASQGFLGLQRYAGGHVEGDVSVRVRDFLVRELP